LDRSSSEFDVIPCGVLQTLDDGTIRRVNRTFCGWVDAPAETLVGRRFQDLLTIGGKIFHHTHWAPLLRLQGSISEVKLELVHGDSVLPILVNVIRRDDAGTIVHEIAAYVARDRDRYEKELVQARHRLEAALAELNVLHAAVKDRVVFAEQMVGIVSHDLRNPLSAVRLGIELLASSELSEPQHRVLARIARAAERSTHLIEDLLDFTKARLGSGIAVTLSPIDLHECIAHCLDELRLSHPTREIVHVLHGEGRCIGDPYRLAQLVGNLVSNANAYGTPNTPITVTSCSGATCAIAVHNHGAQIPNELQATMFEPMTRGESASGNVRSVGLGLFIVREIARAHGGTASVASVETGTTFRVEWRAA
jgi:sigma-B regulation protein RsbU (phosphoserine phosphatase)